jgi:UDP-N-acetylmuramoylalanine--D-glutamate ligase
VVNPRLDDLVSWHAEWRGLRVAVLGLDATGFSVADTLAELGAEVTMVSHGGHATDREELLAVIGVRLEAVDRADADALATFDPELVVVTPGFGARHPLVMWAVDAGVAVWSDIELAWRVRDKAGTLAPWLLVTGGTTAGRTAHLTESMLLASGARAMACGDTPAGVPVLDAVRVPEGWECLVVSVTPSAMHFTTSLSAWAAACLVSTDAAPSTLIDGVEVADPGDGDADLAAVYSRAQVACIYNRDDAATMHMVEEAEVVDGARAIGFGLGVPGPSDFGVVDGILCDRAFHEERSSSALELATVDQLASVGLATIDGVADVLAAAALARSYGVPVGAVQVALGIDGAEED